MKTTKYQLEFENYTKKREIKGIFDSDKQARAAMVSELHKKGIRPYYYRDWGVDGVTIIDFGSHSEFYIIKEINGDE